MKLPDVDGMRAILSGDDHPEIVGPEARLRSAQLNADTVELDQLIANDLLFTGPDGNLATKAEDIAASNWHVVGGHVSEVAR